MVLGMQPLTREPERGQTEDFTYFSRDAYTRQQHAAPGRMPLDNRAALTFEENYRPASRSLCALNPIVPTFDGAAISRGEANDATIEYCAQLDALMSLIDAAWRVGTPQDELLRGYPDAVRHLNSLWVEFRLARDAEPIRLMPGEGYDFARLRKIPAHSPTPDRNNFVPYTEVKALLKSRKETDDAG